MAALLVAMSVMAVMMSVALPQWRTLSQREKEEELIFRGRQYARAITLYQRKVGAGYPPSIDALVAGGFLRRKYKDPITGEDFLPLTGSLSAAQTATGGGGTPSPKPGGPSSTAAPAPASGTSTPRSGPGQPQGPAGAPQGLIGVASRSTAQSIRMYNGRTRYNEWAFVAQAVTQQPTAQGGAQKPGPGAPGIPKPGTPGTAVPRMPSPGTRIFGGR